MIYKISDYLSIDDGILENDFENNSSSINDSKYFDENIKICINGNWYKVIPASELIRRKSSDGYYRAIYIWINYDSGEYYIGKVNAAKKYRLLKYTGSGVKFKVKYNKHKDRFARYYIFYCNSSKETEEIEAKIVNQELLKDPFCLNLVQGGGGISQAPFSEDRIEKQRKYMKEHPDSYKAMLDAAHSFDRRKIEERNNSIRKTMSAEKYKEMSSERIKKWKENNPEEYAKARENNKRSMDNPETKAKRNASLGKWRQEHPEEFAKWEENRKKALASKKHKQRISSAQREWIKNNPEAAKERLKVMHQARNEIVCVPVEMYNLTTKETINTFKSIKEAADWLISNGYTKGKNPSSTITSVCKKKPGRNSYLGFGWRYKDAQ